MNKSLLGVVTTGFVMGAVSYTMGRMDGRKEANEKYRQLGYLEALHDVAKGMIKSNKTGGQ